MEVVKCYVEKQFGLPKNVGGHWMFIGENGEVYRISDDTIDINRLPYEFPGVNENGESICLWLFDADNVENEITADPPVSENQILPVTSVSESTSPPSKKVKNSDSSSQQKEEWIGVDSTKLLISLYATYYPKIKTRQIPSVKRMYELIQAEMELHGYNFTTAQVEHRWKVLDRGYKDSKKINGSSGRGRVSCRFEKELEEVLGKKPNVTPVVMRGPGKKIRQKQLKEIFDEK